MRLATPSTRFTFEDSIGSLLGRWCSLANPGSAAAPGASELIDLFTIESLYVTAFYLPDTRTLVAADLIYADNHPYMADIADPDAWIAEVQRVRGGRMIERVIPGHGPTGGPEQIDALIAYLQKWREVAQPGVRVVDIARAMTERHPDYGLQLLLWVTRGPGFGLSGAADLAVPAEVLGG